jgi:hypothetical protein
MVYRVGKESKFVLVILQQILDPGRWESLDGMNGVKGVTDWSGVDFKMTLAFTALWSEPGTQVRSVDISKSR